MTVAITAAVITALKANTALATALGGQYVYPRYTGTVRQVPGVYISLTNETSSQRPGYATHRHRDANPFVQVDIFSTGSAAVVDAIADAVDTCLFGTAITGTRGWSRVSRSEQFEDDTRVQHVALRFSFSYSIQD